MSDFRERRARENERNAQWRRNRASCQMAAARLYEARAALERSIGESDDFTATPETREAVVAAHHAWAATYRQVCEDDIAADLDRLESNHGPLGCEVHIVVSAESS